MFGFAILLKTEFNTSNSNNDAAAAPNHLKIVIKNIY